MVNNILCSHILERRKIIKTKEKFYKVQDWIPIEKVLENGILKMKNKSYVKIIKTHPINFNLKSDLEKDTIISNYKKFLQICNFDIQIIIQSKKQDLSPNINMIKQCMDKENNKFILEISKKYINYIQNINSEKNLSSKNFYILIKYVPNDTNSTLIQNLDNIAENNLNEKYFKIRDNLSKCGNLVFEFNSKKEIRDILFSFLNSRKFLNYL